MCEKREVEVWTWKSWFLNSDPPRGPSSQDIPFILFILYKTCNFFFLTKMVNERHTRINYSKRLLTFVCIDISIMQATVIARLVIGKFWEREREAYCIRQQPIRHWNIANKTLKYCQEVSNNFPSWTRIIYFYIL